mmetsp:Transcript_27915/g.54388  ORF Transcript_27915/g.54388 Transcript_27915/m.54388 type:complete len:211 (-) Transcript_27915:1499-2131(-)
MMMDIIERRTETLLILFSASSLDSSSTFPSIPAPSPASRVLSSPAAVTITLHTAAACIGGIPFTCVASSLRTGPTMIFSALSVGISKSLSIASSRDSRKVGISRRVPDIRTRVRAATAAGPIDPPPLYLHCTCHKYRHVRGSPGSTNLQSISASLEITRHVVRTTGGGLAAFSALLRCCSPSKRSPFSCSRSAAKSCFPCLVSLAGRYSA